MTTTELVPARQRDTLPGTDGSLLRLRRCLNCGHVRTWHKHAGTGRPAKCGRCGQYSEHQWVHPGDHLTDLMWLLHMTTRAVDDIPDQSGLSRLYFLNQDQLGTVDDGGPATAKVWLGRHKPRSVEIAIRDSLPPWSAVRVLRSVWDCIGNPDRWPGGWQWHAEAGDGPIPGWRLGPCTLHRLTAAVDDWDSIAPWVDEDRLDPTGPCPECGDTT